MANLKSSKQDVTKSIERRLLNQRHKGQMRGSIRRARAAIESPTSGATDPTTAVRQAIAMIDRAASRGAIHRNTASRRKSRLVLKLNTLQKTSA